MTPDESSTAERHQRLARANELELLYRQSFPAVFASLLAGLLVCIALWPVQDPLWLSGWYLVLGVSALARVALFQRYRRAAPEGEALLAWERPYAATLFASTVVWGLGALVIMPAGSMLHQVILLFFLVGMAGGALGAYAPHRRVMLVTIVLLLVPSTLWLAAQGTLLATLMVVGLVVFIITVWRASEVLSAHMHQSFVLSLVLDNARGAAERMAREDELTGMYNRRAFYEEGASLHSRPRGVPRGLPAMILVDVDHFKKVNDAYGHANGDLVLKRVAQVLMETVRPHDFCARIGGEEFGILLWVTRSEDGLRLAEKLRLRLARTVVALQGEHRGMELSITASFGVATGHHVMDRLYSMADEALYRAKAQGRNQVVGAPAF